MRERDKPDAAPPPGPKCTPVDCKPSGRGLKGNRIGGNARPNVPQEERFCHMRVLDWSPVARDPTKNCFALAKEMQCDETRMAEQALNGRNKWSQREAVARRERRRGHPIFGARAVITRAEYERDEPPGISHRHPRRKPDLDRLTACHVHAAETRRQSCRIVGNDQVPRVEQTCK